VSVKVKSRKPGGKVHTVPITGAMLEVLEAQKGNNTVSVFTYECKRSRGQRLKGERYPFSKNGWRKGWKDALDAAGIEDFRFHDLRHTAATRIVRETGNLKIAMKLLGHSDITATARYAHVTDEDLRQGMERSHNTGHNGVQNAPKLAENQG
jgi:integrase